MVGLGPTPAIMCDRSATHFLSFPCWATALLGEVVKDSSGMHPPLITIEEIC